MLSKKEKKEVFISFIKDKKPVLCSILAGVCLFGLSFLWPILSIFSFLILFNAFDLLGYRDCLHGNAHPYNYDTVAYRIMQFMFEVTFLGLIWGLFGIIYALLAKLLHWFGWQDLLYYYVGKYKLPHRWSWMGWTPLGLVSKKKYLSTKEIKLQAIIGLILVILLYLIII